MKVSPNSIAALMNEIHRQAADKGKSLYMITLHPGYRYASSKKWRVPTKETSFEALDGFVRLMNSFLRNQRSYSNYVKGLVAVEKNQMGEPHFHMLVEQTTSDAAAFEKKLNKLMGTVNSTTYVVKTDIEHKGSRGIGYENANGQYMHFTKVEDQEKLIEYLTKFASSEYIVLKERKLDYEEPLKVTWGSWAMEISARRQKWTQDRPRQ